MGAFFAAAGTVKVAVRGGVGRHQQVGAEASPQRRDVGRVEALAGRGRRADVLVDDALDAAVGAQRPAQQLGRDVAQQLQVAVLLVPEASPTSSVALQPGKTTEKAAGPGSLTLNSEKNQPISGQGLKNNSV